MRYTAFLFIFFLVEISTCFSQAKGINDLTKVAILDPGISQEKRMAKYQSLFVQLFLSPDIEIGYSSSLGNTSSFNIDPVLGFQYRYYYNAARREAKKKKTGNNNLNYFAPVYQLIYSKKRISSSYYEETKRRAINVAGLVWGLQRNFPRQFSLDLNLGLGYLFTSVTYPDYLTGQPVAGHDSQLTGIVQLTIGFWLKKKGAG